MATPAADPKPEATSINGWTPPIIYDIHFDGLRVATQRDVDELGHVLRAYGLMRVAFQEATEKVRLAKWTAEEAFHYLRIGINDAHLSIPKRPGVEFVAVPASTETGPEIEARWADNITKRDVRRRRATRP